jgi:AcrR family transcriptional regulator
MRRMGERPKLERSPRKPKGAGAERRAEILSAALGLFGRYGLYGVSTRQIAGAVGISQPTLYAYFASKDEIARVLHEDAFQELERRLSAGMDDVTDRESLAKALRIYIDFGLENPDAYRMAFMIEGPLGRGTTPGEPDIPIQGHACFEMLRSTVRAVLERGIARYDDPERHAQLIWASMHGLVSLMIARPGFPWLDRERLIAAHVSLLAEASVVND